MRGKIPAGIAIALAFMVPAAPAMAQSASPGLDQNCQTVERKTFTDIRELFTFDLDTATATQLRVLANQIQATAKKESLTTLPDATQKRLDGTSEDLRAWLKNDAQAVWTIDLRIKVGQTMTGAGPKVKEAAQKTLDAETVDPYLAYLNEGLYAARALDCAAQPTPTPTTSPTTTQPTPTASATSTVAPTAATSTSPVAAGGDGGGLPVTGADTATVAGIGGALLLVGGASFVIARRRRSRFVA
ncbi:LPXTG cell wall anchor domain-containing protein [Micromonospora sp. NPDC049107]|uniref:LPXTG cell wall anchor domain-containing protein n=1 Tax=Micromonospora sp. NPDC049107 TaxID=3154349 RepID=UPI0033F95152